MPARPMAKARVFDQSTPARCSSAAPAVVEHQVAVLLEPAVQVDPGAKRAEAVVGDDHEQRVVAPALLDRLADEVVHPPVEVVDHVAAGQERRLGPGGVPSVDVAPERVLEAVGAVEHAGDEPTRDLVECVEEHRLALVGPCRGTAG